MPAPDRRYHQPLTVHTRQQVQAFTIERHDGRCYVSALLDANVCGPCEERDGEEFDSVAEATAEFPNGPNPLCEGMERCRCVIVAIMDDEQPTLA